MTTAMQLFVDGLNFPTSLTFGPDATLYVAESGLPFAGAPSGGVVWQVDADGKRERVCEGLRAPVNGLLWHDGGLIISEGGHPGPAHLARGHLGQAVQHRVRWTFVEALAPGMGGADGLVEPPGDGAGEIGRAHV